jgi:hypothetical protein
MKHFSISKKNIFETSKLIVNAKTIGGSSVIIPHVCNNVDLFGAGFAAAVAATYPISKDNYHLLGKKFLKDHPGYTQFIDVSYEKQYNRRLIIANMIAQNGVRSKNNPRPLNYAYLTKSMLEVKKFININFDSENSVEIHCPKFGSGLAGGNWKFIEYLIEDIWNNIKVVVHEVSTSFDRV